MCIRDRANKIDGEVPTVLSDSIVEETSKRYQEIYTRVTGKPFQISDEPYKTRIYNNLIKAGIIQKAFIGLLEGEDELEEYKTRAKQSGLALEKIDLSSAFLKTFWEDAINHAVEPVLLIGHHHEGLNGILISFQPNSSEELMKVVLEKTNN